MLRSAHVRAIAVFWAMLLVLASCSSGEGAGGTDDSSVTSSTTARATSPTTAPIDPATLDSDERLTAAITGQLLADGAFRVGGDEAACVAAGTVEVMGALRLAQAGITVSDPNGPDDDPYAGFSPDELGDVVAVWATCTNVARLVTEALLASAPSDVSPAISGCIEQSLSAGLGARFLLSALNNSDGTDQAVTDVLRVLDGCTIGAQLPDLADADIGLWPWLAVDLPGYDMTVIDTSSPDAVELTGFLSGVAAVDGIEASAMRAVDQADGSVSAALIVASVDTTSGDGLAVDDYVAGLLSSAEGLEVFEFTLPSGAEVLGWEAEEEELVFLLWVGERVVVFATGTIEAVDVLSLYTELVPTP